MPRVPRKARTPNPALLYKNYPYAMLPRMRRLDGEAAEERARLQERRERRVRFGFRDGEVFKLFRDSTRAEKRWFLEFSSEPEYAGLPAGTFVAVHQSGSVLHPFATYNEAAAAVRADHEAGGPAPLSFYIVDVGRQAPHYLRIPDQDGPFHQFVFNPDMSFYKVNWGRGKDHDPVVPCVLRDTSVSPDAIATTAGTDDACDDCVILTEDVTAMTTRSGTRSLTSRRGNPIDYPVVRKLVEINGLQTVSDCIVRMDFIPKRYVGLNVIRRYLNVSSVAYRMNPTGQWRPRPGLQNEVLL
ncbi:unnamed protein product (mitochondrion) [Plasmodiophora brassicae]|uniref:Uncharacterized protein n=1 Tax=Plasmodiophora brassicae TaxID=37360 RepID=A0A0G4J084_PLABS|nr:hypothetical protein PBRA_008307 [Plasmodiophora brassicae]SPQ95293.1 unnamed protein product [Plasmodiophora brassicae]